MLAPSPVEQAHAADGDDHYRARMDAFYAEQTRPQIGGEGPVTPEWAIDAETGRFLYDLTRRLRPRLSIEIGLCQGASALHFASALAANGAGLHLAIDPYQEMWFRDQGVMSIARHGLDPWFKLLRIRSDRALPLLEAAGMTADLIFIDGDHRFDAVMTDFVLADRLLAVGGHMIFDEGGYECPTERVASFLASNKRNYERLDAPQRLYAYRKAGDDTRSFADWHDF